MATPTAEELLEQCIAGCARDAGSRISTPNFPYDLSVSATELWLARRCAAAEANLARLVEAVQQIASCHRERRKMTFGGKWRNEGICVDCRKKWPCFDYAVTSTVLREIKEQQREVV